ncbi:MAG: DUF4405 domain-containing protein [Gammaproteobacteria bacterium]|nr:DUF4405 domain-containing protein [Gammaproteobacteria bacterium]MCW8927256.1 DUF4405 domain-containing protein [Gammaproteobacteria bacterium]MCW8972690.1 DUF4405 domain-containing protein [Gammaproteobacteria bacterium]MCW8992345.1 DUF4405 domain-containing protein [Gammaproteobacteria bacterium]
MKRATLISLIDVVAFIAFLFLTSSGILLRYMLPPGSGRWSEVWGMSRHDWGTVHFWLSVVFFAVLTFHLLQHWRFVLGLFRGHLKEGVRLRVALGLVGLVAVILLGLAPLLSPVAVDENRQDRPFRGSGQGLHQPLQPE